LYACHVFVGITTATRLCSNGLCRTTKGAKATLAPREILAKYSPLGQYSTLTCSGRKPPPRHETTRASSTGTPRSPEADRIGIFSGPAR
jgi:hypothetical protein